MTRDMMANQVRVYERVLRFFGRSEAIPRKLRSKFLTQLAGNQRQLPGRNFVVTNGGKIYEGNTSSHIDWHVFYFGEYDPVGIRFLKLVAQQINPVFVDIGSNTGTHTLSICDCCKHVHCIEPNPRVLSILKKNLARNQVNNATVHEFGLSNTSALLPFFQNQHGNDGAGTFIDQNRAHDNILPVNKADEIFPQVGISTFELVKIDSEGHEVEILQGVKEQFAGARPVVLWESSMGHMQTNLLADSLYPPSYLHFRLSFRGRWQRITPTLYPMQSDRGRNVVSIPTEKLHLVNALISPNA